LNYLCGVLALNDFSFEFAGRYLFKNASWHIKPNEKIGLVGLNGTGKSTLLRLISGDWIFESGFAQYGYRRLCARCCVEWQG